MVVGRQVLQVVDGEQLPAAEFGAEFEFGLALDSVVRAVAKIGGRRVGGDFVTELRLPVTNQALRQMCFAGAAGTEQHEDGRREFVGWRRVGRRRSRLHQRADRAGDEAILWAGDKSRQRFAGRTAVRRSHWAAPTCGRAVEFR